MVSRETIAVATLGAAIFAAPLAAQTSAAGPAQPRPRSAAQAVDERAQLRFQISQLERLFEGAVEHGATLFRQRFQAATPAQLQVAEFARARGFRLDGYGVFFDVEVPGVEGMALAYSFRTLDQNGLGLDSALKEIRAAIAPKGDTNLDQALRRIELQVSMPGVSSGPVPPGARLATGSTASVDANAGVDPMLADPSSWLENFRAEIVAQLKDAMLEYSGPLALQDDEWLTIAARRTYDRPMISPGDSDARTVVIRIRGGDLSAFRANRLSKDEALNKMEVREF